MALGADHTTTTTAATYIPEMWSQGLNDFFRANLKAAAFFEDWSEDVAGGGDVIHRPNISEMTANTYAFGSLTQVTLNAPTHGTVDLTVNVHKEVSFLLQDDVMSQLKSSYNSQEKWMMNAGYTAAATLEDALLALFEAFSTVVGASHLSMNDSNIRAAISALDVANVPETDRAFFMYPAQIWKEVMGIDRFTLLTNTQGADPVLKGAVGLLYGIPVVGSSRIGVGTNVATTKGSRLNALCHSSALAFAVANPAGMSASTVRLQAQYLQEYLGTLVTADVIYGVIENRDTSGILMQTASS
jgi:hypothetical protein